MISQRTDGLRVVTCLSHALPTIVSCQVLLRPWITQTKIGGFWCLSPSPPAISGVRIVLHFTLFTFLITIPSTADDQ